MRLGWGRQRVCSEQGAGKKRRLPAVPIVPAALPAMSAATLDL
jgi:hypothetical protein